MEHCNASKALKLYAEEIGVDADEIHAVIAEMKNESERMSDARFNELRRLITSLRDHVAYMRVEARGFERDACATQAAAPEEVA